MKIEDNDSVNVETNRLEIMNETIIVPAIKIENCIGSSIKVLPIK